MPKNPPKRLPSRLVDLDLSKLECIDYAIDTWDILSGRKGTFAYDEQMFKQHAWYFAISPVFPEIQDFYVWAKAQGFAYHRIGFAFRLCRTFE